MHSTSNDHSVFGKLAYQYVGKRLPFVVLQSAAGFYIGTCSDDGPCSRESAEYFRSSTAAEIALRGKQWTQRDEP